MTQICADEMIDCDDRCRFKSPRHLRRGKKYHGSSVNHGYLWFRQKVRES